MRLASLGEMLISLFRNQPLILALARRELQSRHVGTFGGFTWTFAHPLGMMLVFYLVFSVGFKAKGPGELPFALWFVCGMVPWLFFSETLQAVTASVVRCSPLVKKTVFPSEVLPVVHIVAGAVNHGVFLLLILAMLMWFHVNLLPARLSFVWFLFGLCGLLTGLGWLLAAVQVFYRDVSHIVTVVLNMWFWATPIVWSPEMLPREYHRLLLINPMYYIVEGYRGALISEEIAWPEVTHALAFWCTVVILLAAGAAVFKRLKPDFVDVL